MSLAQRSIISVSWNIFANVIALVVLFFRSVLLARLLPVDVFGIYAFASSLVTLTGIIPSFGMGGAFLHRAPETSNESETANVHFTLKLIFTCLWAGLLLIVTVTFTEGDIRTTLFLLIITRTGLELTQTPELIFYRRVDHRRLAIIRTVNAIATTIVAVGLAIWGVTLWAILATDIVQTVITMTLLFFWKPVWYPRLAWSTPLVRYFLNFGRRNLVASILVTALDRIDDLWTGSFLGQTPLGYYSRAYTFATYPRQVVALPFNLVTGGTYAELKEKRLALSKAFFLINAVLLRIGFMFAGILTLVAPEFIRLLIGVQWLPMLDVFRLMLVFTLLDPINVTVVNLFIAVGRPELVVRIRLIQLIVLVGGLFLLGPLWGITGVALAVNTMLITGIVMLLSKAKTYVDFSIIKLFFSPAVALTLSLLITYGTIGILDQNYSDWLTGFIKLVEFTVVYVGTLLIMEKNQMWAVINLLTNQFDLRSFAGFSKLFS